MEKIEKILEKITYFIREGTLIPIPKEVSEAIIDKVSSYLLAFSEAISKDFSEEEIDFFKYVVESLLTREIEKAIKSGDFSKFRNEYIEFNDSVIFHDENIKIDVLIKINKDKMFFEKKSRDKEKPGKMKKEYIFLFDPRVQCLDPSFSPICIVKKLKVRIGGIVEYEWEYLGKFYPFIINDGGKNIRKEVYFYYIQTSGDESQPEIELKLPETHILNNGQRLLFNVGNLLCSVEADIFFRDKNLYEEEGIRSITFYNENNYNSKPDLSNYNLSKAGLKFTRDSLMLYPLYMGRTNIRGITCLFRYFGVLEFYGFNEIKLSYIGLYFSYISILDIEKVSGCIRIVKVESDDSAKRYVSKLIEKGYIPKEKKYYLISSSYFQNYIRLHRYPEDVPLREEDYKLTIYYVSPDSSKAPDLFIVDEDFIKEFIRLLGFSF